MAGMVLWNKRGAKLTIAELDNGCTLIESDEMPQVLNFPSMDGIFKDPTIAGSLERETRKHLPEGYIVQAGRQENMHAYYVNVWKVDESGKVQGLEDVVIRVLIGHEALKNWFQHSVDWRLDLIYHLQRDFDARHRTNR